MPKPTQTALILDYMERFGSINPLEAMMDLGCMRLAARIADLRSQGHLIKGKIVDGVNRFGEPVHFSEYSLVTEEGGADE
jgi:hypothetical protein